MRTKKFNVILVLISIVLIVISISIEIGYADLNEGLVAYYPFNGNANDESGNGNHGSVHGATLTVDRCGMPDRAYRFNGSDYIDLGNGTVNVAGDLTLSLWVKVDGSQ